MAIICCNVDVVRSLIWMCAMPGVDKFRIQGHISNYFDIDCSVVNLMSNSDFSLCHLFKV